MKLNQISIDTEYQGISDTTWQALFEKAISSGVLTKRHELFSGNEINVSEKRPALHTALRNISKSPVLVNGINIMPQIEAIWHSIERIDNQLRGVTDIIHIGIGGSDFGPKLVCDALLQKPHKENRNIRIHFLSNLDSAQLEPILKTVEAKSTRIIIVSKAFTTLETIQNATTVLDWLSNQGVLAQEIKNNIFAVTANPQQAITFGVSPENILPFWDWVGGRFSVWSAVGLSIALKFGFKVFQEFLAGAYAMDHHFKTAEPINNQPLKLALTTYHNQIRFGSKSQAIIPYAHRLQLFTEWLQQLEMESNGKTATLDNHSTTISAPVIFGTPGTNAQHSFFQMLHQGPEIIPVDFIAIREPMSDLPQAKIHHRMLIANCLAQSQALALGKPSNSSDNNLNEKYPGMRPSNLIWLPRLDAFNLGSLMALYEHRTFCLGVLYGLNSFDQPGVELGKVLAKPIDEALSNPSKLSLLNSFDDITKKRIEWFNSKT